MIALEKPFRYALGVSLLIILSYLTWYFFFFFCEITLVYLGTLNQLINCHILLNLVSRDLFRA